MKSFRFLVLLVLLLPGNSFAHQQFRSGHLAFEEEGGNTALKEVIEPSDRKLDEVAGVAAFVGLFLAAWAALTCAIPIPPFTMFCDDCRDNPVSKVKLRAPQQATTIYSLLRFSLFVRAIVLNAHAHAPPLLLSQLVLSDQSAQTVVPAAIPFSAISRVIALLPGLGEHARRVEAFAIQTHVRQESALLVSTGTSAIALLDMK